MNLRPALPADCALLARMNKQLIEDERSRNPMTLEQLERRMARWLARGEYQVELIETERPVGYIVYRTSPDEFYPEQKVVYLRQFFIARECRRKGLGRAAIALWMESRVTECSRVILEVLAKNRAGLEFWRSLGFGDYAHVLLLTK
ncbi:MAG: GNAT family N-acetyltransferase [Meiothermus sp.]|nr:GNAT family N-acetyltransferase [Meiothermus sp.]